MPIKYDLRYSNDLAIFTLTGELVPEDTIQVLDAYFKTGILGFEIVDASMGTIRNLKLKQMTQVIDWVAANAVTRPAVSKSAFIVPFDADNKTSQFFHLLTTFNRAAGNQRWFVPCWRPIIGWIFLRKACKRLHRTLLFFMVST